MAAEATPQEPPASVTIDGKEYSSLADGEYDAIILGTGLQQVLLAGMLTLEQGKRVLVVDHNGYYGGEAASLNLDELHQKFVDPKSESASAAFKGKLGDNRDYCVDLVPKFVMADGLLVKILLKMNAQDYLDFRLIDGSYVYKHATDSMLWGKAQLLHKVPATESEALSTGLVSMWGKRGLRNFLMYVSAWKEDDASTHKDFNATSQTAAELYAKFGLDEGAIDFVGHAMALQADDSYLTRPALDLIKAVQLYAYSLAAHTKSPYLYPVYGLSTLPEAFSRVCAVRGGIFMLNQQVDEILFSEGKVAGVRVGDSAASAPIVICSPDFAPADRKRSTGRIVRTLALLDHPIAQIKDAASAQVIIPQKQVKRQHDIYMTVLSRQHNVVADGKYLAIISTIAETATPQAEVGPGIELCGDLLYRFDNITETFVPTDDGTKDNLFVMSSLDATSHFESVAREVLDTWRRVTGTDFDLKPAAPDGAAGASGSA